MSVIPVIASAADLEAAIKFAHRNRSARWYVAKRAESLGCSDQVPQTWGPIATSLTAAFNGEWTDKAREKAASDGVAMKDGSYPIKDKQDLKRAIQAFGRAKGDKESVRKHIIERARALKARDVLPDSWHVSITADAGERSEGAVEEPTHAGLAVHAADTGRVLMLQRALDEEDPASGKWEFPGGGIDDSDKSPFDGACREFCEETGLPVPDGENGGSWTSPDGVYRGHIIVVPVEAEAFSELNPNLEAAHNVENPDNPDRQNPEVTAWMHPDEIKDNPAVRSEVLESTDWSMFDPEAKSMVESDVDSPENESEEMNEVDSKYRPIAAAANGLHFLTTPYPEEISEYMSVLATDFSVKGLTASGMKDWDDHPDSVPSLDAVRYEKISRFAEANGIVASSMMGIKGAQETLGWSVSEQMSEIAAGAYLEDYPVTTLVAAADFLYHRAPDVSNAIREFAGLDPITAGWNPNLHPRDREGQFLEVGDIVNVFTTKDGDTPSGQGKIVGSSEGMDGKIHLQVKRNEGGVVDVPVDRVTAAPEHKASLSDQSHIMNPDPVKNPGVQTQLSGKSDQQIQLMANDSNLRQTDRQKAQNEFDRRKGLSDGKHDSNLDEDPVLDEWLSKQSQSYQDAYKEGYYGKSSTPAETESGTPKFKAGDSVEILGQSMPGQDRKVVNKAKVVQAGDQFTVVETTEDSKVDGPAGSKIRISTSLLRNPETSASKDGVPDLTPGSSNVDKQALRDRVNKSNNAARLEDSPAEQAYRDSRDDRVKKISEKSPAEIKDAADVSDQVVANYVKLYGETDPITVRAASEAKMIRDLAGNVDNAPPAGGENSSAGDLKSRLEASNGGNGRPNFPEEDVAALTTPVSDLSDQALHNARAVTSLVNNALYSTRGVMTEKEQKDRLKEIEDEMAKRRAAGGHPHAEIDDVGYYGRLSDKQLASRIKLTKALQEKGYPDTTAGRNRKTRDEKLLANFAHEQSKRSSEKGDSGKA